MKDNFVIRVPVLGPEMNGTNLVRLDNATIYRVKNVSRRTGLPMKEVFARCVNFALDRLVVEQEGDGNANA